MRPIIDPRDGDIEDDASSTKSHSLLSLAGSLLAEISLPKLIVAWVILLILPSLLLGLAPLAVTAWINTVAAKLVSPFVGMVPLLILVAVLALGWMFARRLFHLAESSFWSLTALAVEPAYTMCRESLRHLAEWIVPESTGVLGRERARAIAAALAGLLICALALWVLSLAWPSSRWVGEAADFLSPRRLAPIALANTVVLISAYFAVAAVVWAIADLTMPPPRDMPAFASLPPGGRRWRVAHLSDLHAVGERYGYRIECGRAGPQGNGRIARTFARLAEIDAAEPVDAILISGDLTDAGRAAEWAELLDVLADYPQLANRVLALPGNHDINIVDRANPARLDLPMSPHCRLRKLRALSVMAGLQGSRVRVIDFANGCLGTTLDDALRKHRGDLARFAVTGRPFFSTQVTDLWQSAFPMVLPPEPEDGLGIILLNTNADSHFSFTNALGMISAEQVRGIEIAAARYPRASWIVGLHHHVIEYPRPAKVLSERIGTALVNGNWFLRALKPMAGRIVLMHGHRHIDWIGECGGLVIVSAPSPVMELGPDRTPYFYIHTLEVDADGPVTLLKPQLITVPDAGDPAGAGGAKSAPVATAHPSSRPVQEG